MISPGTRLLHGIGMGVLELAALGEQILPVRQLPHLEEGLVRAGGHHAYWL